MAGLSTIIKFVDTLIIIFPFENNVRDRGPNMYTTTLEPIRFAEKERWINANDFEFAIIHYTIGPRNKQ